MTPHQRFFSDGLGDMYLIRTKQNSQSTAEQFAEVSLELIFRSPVMKYLLSDF